MKIISFHAETANVTGYLQDDYDTLKAHKERPAVVILAGGAYRWLSPREKDPVALFFAAMGYQTFLPEYSVGPMAGEYRPLREIAETIRRIRKNSAKWHIRKDAVALLGFSAGGHLAASLGILWNDPELSLGKETRPDALILCYPVITTGAFAHEESVGNVTGNDKALLQKLSLERQVSADMPPTFLWHCTRDESVPVENSLLLAQAMQKAGVDYECHLFAGGAHGISMCTQEVETPYPDCAAWTKLCRTWLNRKFAYVP